MDNNRRNPLNSRKPNKDKNNYFLRQVIIMVLGALVISQLIQLFYQGSQNKDTLTYSVFYSMLKSNKETPLILSAEMIDNKLEGLYVSGGNQKKYQVYIPADDKDLLKMLRDNVREFKVTPPQTFWTNFFYYLAWPVLFMFFFWYILSRGAKQAGGGIFSFGKMKAKLIGKGKTKVTFLDVAGVDEAKEELTEVIEYLKDPKRFQRLGGKIPKGVLLVGPPGCGKTLIAKAVSGEADVPFYSISGSDFVELFVGVGASRVRDLFEQSKKASKISHKGCIIFIDEIDAVGRQRFAGIGGGHDEREQTLNQLLVEMDGFESNAGVIVMAATNRPDVLDPALLRPGRFDRHVVIDRPDILGREDILKVHIRNIKTDKKVDLNSVARQTPGFSGADLANLCNEAALLAARRNKGSVSLEEMEESIERVMSGPQRKSKVISKKEKRIVSIHESGHALLSVFLSDTDPLHKVSIIPRGIGALGYTMQLPQQDRYITTENELLSRICVLLGGRISESLILGELSTGAQNDLEIATELARKMVTQFGMSPKLGNVTLGQKQGPIFLGRDLVEHKDYSEETARLIDEEIKRVIDKAYSRAESVIKDNKDKLNELSSVLLEREILNAEEVRKILGIKDKENTSQNESEDALKDKEKSEDTGKDS